VLSSIARHFIRWHGDMITAKPSTYRVFVIGTLGAMLAHTASGWGQATINAQVTGGGGSGKCTFEVRVDGVADVQIRGNQGYLQTKAGMPAQWVRLKCNQPLPRNPNNFRFAGVDGRGKQSLLRDPAQNNGIAVVRIEDPKSGYEGYTGDIMWDGGNNNGGNNGGWWIDRLFLLPRGINDLERHSGGSQRSKWHWLGVIV